MAKQKNYTIEVELKFTNSMPASSAKEAIKRVKASFADEYDIDLTDKEIISVEVIK